MTDLEISRALARAIGWREDQIVVIRDRIFIKGMLLFDHADWQVAAPIAERFDCFPSKACSSNHVGEWYTPVGDIANGVYADTPQKAIALAVIEGAKT